MEVIFIKDLKNHYFEGDSFYSILDSFNLLGKIERIKQSFKNDCIEDVLEGVDVYSGCNNLGWDASSSVINNLKDLPQDEVLDLVMNAGSTNDLVDAINDLYLKKALKLIGKFLCEVEEWEFLRPENIKVGVTFLSLNSCSVSIDAYFHDFVFVLYFDKEGQEQPNDFGNYDGEVIYIDNDVDSNTGTLLINEAKALIRNLDIKRLIKDSLKKTRRLEKTTRFDYLDYA